MSLLPVNAENNSTVVLTHLEPDDGGQQILTAFDGIWRSVSIFI
jgi:hypothetical protein